MYRVLIVDDEKMIRMGMKNAIDWKKLGVDDVFTAASGNEALKILKEEGPEIMVTDIQMTEMTGLELIKAARESVPELRVIVLTGFDNFEYARESLRLQVQDFFLKPIDEDLSRIKQYAACNTDGRDRRGAIPGWRHCRFYSAGPQHAKRLSQERSDPDQKQRIPQDHIQTGYSDVSDGF